MQQQRNYFVSIGGATGRFIESINNTNVSWKLGLQYQANNDVMLFGSIGQGYKGPGFNTENLGIDEVPFAVQDEVSTTVEAAVTSSFQANYEQALNDSIYGFINASMYYRSELNFGMGSPERTIGIAVSKQF